MEKETRALVPPARNFAWTEAHHHRSCVYPTISRRFAPNCGQNGRLQPETLCQRRGCRTDSSIVALPVATAFAIAARLKPQSGIRTALIAGALISAPGGSAVQISGATGAFLVIVYGILERSPDVWPAASRREPGTGDAWHRQFWRAIFWRHASHRDDCAHPDRPTHWRDLPLSGLGID